MKKALFFISLFLLPLLGISQTVKSSQIPITSIHSNSRINNPRRSSNYHPIKDRHFGKHRGGGFEGRHGHRHHGGRRAYMGRTI